MGALPRYRRRTENPFPTAKNGQKNEDLRGGGKNKSNIQI